MSTQDQVCHTKLITAADLLRHMALNVYDYGRVVIRVVKNHTTSPYKT
jgi:hypothetical protein